MESDAVFDMMHWNPDYDIGLESESRITILLHYSIGTYYDITQWFTLIGDDLIKPDSVRPSVHIFSHLCSSAEMTRTISEKISVHPSVRPYVRTYRLQIGNRWSWKGLDGVIR